MAEFQWWLLLLGLVAGGGIVAVVYLDGARRDQDIADEELPAEAVWISERLAARGRSADPAIVERVLLEHRTYLLEPPPDRFEPVDRAGAAGSGAAVPHPAPVPSPASGSTDVSDERPSPG
jgi:hypothetical protein